jgi:hypothetical protein
VSRVAFSRDGKLLASGGGDIRLWDVDVGCVLYQEEEELLGSECTFVTDPKSWKQQACKVANRNLSLEEWQKYFPGEPYRKVCAELPVPAGVPEQGGENGKK